MGMGDFRGRGARPALLVWCALACLTCARAAEPPGVTLILERDQILSEALEYLRGHGLRVVYSDQLVPPDLTVLTELRGADPEQLARAALEPWGLQLRVLDAGILAVVATRAPRWRLQGKVLAIPDRAPVVGARVELQGSRFVAWTDEQGAFVVRGQVGGSERLRISAGGYVAVEQGITTFAGELPPLAVELAPAAAELDEVTVVASRFAFEKQTPGVFVLDQSAFNTQPKNGEDALQAIQRIPGMAFSGVSGRANVRGGDSDETLVLLDGMPIREPFHLPGYVSPFSVLDESLIARLTSYSGSIPSRYGNRLAAVIDVESMEASNATPDLIGASTFNARLRLSGGPAGQGKAGTGWLLSARKGTLRSWLAHAAPDVGRPDTSDGYFKLLSRNEAGDEIAVHGLLGHSTFSFADDESGDWARLRSNTGYLWTDAGSTLGSVRFSALLGYSWIESWRDGGLGGGLTPAGSLRDERDASLWDLQLNAEGAAGARHRWQGGVSLTSGRGYYDYDSSVSFDNVAQELFSLPATRQRSGSVHTDRDLLGIHLQDRWQLLNKLYLETGMRLDRAFASGAAAATRFSPRVSLRWSATDATTLRIGWSRAVQFPEAHQLRIEDGETSLPAAQRVDQAVMSLEHRLRSGLEFRAEIYDRRTPNPRVRYTNLFDTLHVLPELAADRIALVPDAVQVQGLEFAALWERGAWKASGAYTWSHAREKFAGDWVDRDWDQRHTLHLSTAWQGGPWSLGAEATVRSGRPTTAFIDQSLASPELGPRGAARYHGQISLDLRVARRFQTGLGDLNVYLQLTNVLDRYNRCCTELDLPDEDSDPDLLEVQGKKSYPLLPALGFQLEF